MDIGKLEDNNTFYEGYEGEPEITLSLVKHPHFCIHIWEGYLEDIFDSFTPDGKSWNGFTKQYQEDSGLWGPEGIMEITDVTPYLKDLRQYNTTRFHYPETAECLSLIVSLLEYAQSTKENVKCELM